MSDNVLGHPLAVALVISGDAEFAAGYQYAFGLVEQRSRHESPFVVFGLGPWIGIINVQHGNRPFPHESGEKIHRFRMEHLQIRRRVRLFHAPLALAEPLARDFHAQKVRIGTGKGRANEKESLAEAKLDLQGILIAEDLGEGQGARQAQLNFDRHAHSGWFWFTIGFAPATVVRVPSSHKSKAHRESMAFVHVVIAGNIGAGKTTLTGLMARHYGWRPYYERVDSNPFLEDFYGDMARWAFALQVFFLSHRVEDHRIIAERRESAVQDRSLSEDALIFARNLAEMGQMSGREWESYRRLYEQARLLLRQPDLVIYLRRSVDGLRDNIQKRGRDYEADIPVDYLARLNGFYEEWIAGEAAPLLIVDADRTDFLGGNGDVESLIRQIDCAFDQGELFGDPVGAPGDDRFILRRGGQAMAAGKMLGGRGGLR